MMSYTRAAIATAALAALAACGGGDGQISGTITGLTSDGLVLSDGIESLTISSGTTSFTFPTVLTDGQSYNVVVKTQPTGLFCTVANGSGTVSSSTPSADITVTCSASFGISGSVTGLTGSGLVVTEVNDNFTESYSIGAGASTFAFPTLVANGANYTVSITTQPTGQTCTIAHNIGTVDGGPVNNVTITCP